VAKDVVPELEARYNKKNQYTDSKHCSADTFLSLKSLLVTLDHMPIRVIKYFKVKGIGGSHLCPI
jgi:hypothetical protein